MLVLNGIESYFDSKKLGLMFGRFLYLTSNGRIKCVREFLKLYYNCDSHIELLVKLRLVESVAWYKKRPYFATN